MRLEVVSSSQRDLRRICFQFRQDEKIDDAIRSRSSNAAVARRAGRARISNCELQAANAELREKLAADHGSKITDLPPLLRSSRANKAAASAPC
jgi:hypothetical protein